MRPARVPLLDVLARDVTAVSCGWLKVEQAEADLATALGRGARVKLASRDEIDALCRPRIRTLTGVPNVFAGRTLADNDQSPQRWVLSPSSWSFGHWGQ